MSAPRRWYWEAGLGELERRDAPASDLFVVPPSADGSPVQLRFDWTFNSAAFRNEVGVYALDAADGRVGGLRPTDPGYAAAALARGQTVFAAGTGPGARANLTFAAGQLLGLYLTSNAGREAALAGRAVTLFSFDGANPRGGDYVLAGDRGDGGRDFRFEDLPDGDFDFDDAVIAVGRSRTVTPAGQVGQTVRATFTRVAREADFRNEVGLVRADGPDGAVGGVRPGAAGYLAAALGSPTRRAIFSDASDPDLRTRVLDLEAGRPYLFYLVTNGTAEDVLARNPGNNPGDGRPLAYFSAPEANPDGLDHLAWRGTASFGLEDLFGGGDRDFDDLVVGYEFAAPTGRPAPADTTPPQAAQFDLAFGSDSGAAGDGRTGLDRVALSGTTEAGASVELRSLFAPGSAGTVLQRVTAGPDGAFRFNGVALQVGTNTFSVRATDAAGNASAPVTRTFVRTRPPTVQAANRIADQTVAVGQARTFNLLAAFDTFARFTTSEGAVDVELFEDTRPITVDNFLRYVNSPDPAFSYNDSLFHRLARGFVLQGGGFKFNPDGVGTAATFPPVSKFAQIQNEPGISNTRGTIAMAKLGGNPNSATNEFFFNLADNSANLDFQNGGFTVFGRVTDAGLEVIDAIAAGFNEFNGPNLPGAPPFPVRPGANTANFPDNLTPGDVARVFRADTLADARRYVFQVTSGDPGVATAAVSGSTLTVVPAAAGTTRVTVRATDPEGLTETFSFNVTVGP